MIICLFPAVAGRLTVARKLSPWSSIAISILLQHHCDKLAPMFAPQVKLRQAVQQGMAGMRRGAAAHMLGAQRVFQGLVVRSPYAEINLET